MPRRTTRHDLTPEQHAEDDRIHAALLHAAADLRELDRSEPSQWTDFWRRSTAA